ncbi:hypothetical protein [Chitinimonas sp. BJB300]|uniref:hypothetical protein n=1 Tax=Chitinimonas sp. BJB300 TaxID=1559339 RepID=UPI0018EC58B6|nr:hypothetical protein [Chitinimonas sp. BJB300]
MLPVRATVSIVGVGKRAHLDLALWLVRRSSPALATLTARYLVMDPRPSQAVFVISDHVAHTEPIVERFDHWANGFSVTAQGPG